MPMFHNILFPVDFSDQCKTAAPYIADITNRFDAELHLLHVLEKKHFREEKLRLGPLFGRHAEELKAFACLLPGGKRWTRTVTHGNPAQAIVSYAQTRGADLIFMPTSGKGRLRRWILGSTTESVLRQAPCAVWTDSGTGLPHTRWSPVLCAIDLERGSEQVLSYAAGVAEQLNARLLVVHAIPSPSEGLLMHPSDLPPTLSHTEAQRVLKRLMERLDVVADPITEMGSVVDTISRVAVQTRAKLLVIGRDGQNTERIGIHTYNLVATAPCPVLTCRSGPASTDFLGTEWQQENVGHKANNLIEVVCR